MRELRTNRVADTDIADSRWQDLYKIGGISCLIVVTLVLCAIIAFFIWPYRPGTTATADIFATLQNDRLGGLMSLDLLFLVTELVTILPILALYVALKRVNESFALIALVLGLITVVALIPARPLSELVVLSGKYATATTEAAKSQYLAAGEALLGLFDGTARMVCTIFMGVSGLINSVLTLRSDIFSKTTACVGIIATISGLAFFIPVIGTLLLLIATFGGVIWNISIARTFLGLGWGKSNAPQVGLF